jgi:DNA-directed RNA polymerase specialized sigma24 family protein
VYEDPGVPHAEVAVKVGLSVQRVRQILCEVRKTLREALEVRDD